MPLDTFGAGRTRSSGNVVMTEWRNQMHLRRVRGCPRIGLRPQWRSRLPLIVGLTLAATLAVVLPSQASAASSPVITLPDPCPAEIASGSDTAVYGFCKQLDSARIQGNPRYEMHYKASTRRRIRRLVSNEARRYFYAGPALAAGASTRPMLIAGDFLRVVKEFAKKSLKVLKRVVGGAIRFVPQAKLINCGLLGGFAAVAAGIDGKQIRGVATAALLGCASAFLPLRK
jgi:hypothetical protein